MPNNSAQELTFTVADMNCPHCESKVSAALKTVPGVISSTPNATTKKVQVSVDGNASASFEAMAKAVEDAGYTLTR